jgi:hypothetical protein
MTVQEEDMLTDAEKIRELVSNVSKAVGEMVSTASEHGEDSEEAEMAKDRCAVAEKELNDFKCGLRKKSA